MRPEWLANFQEKARSGQVVLGLIVKLPSLAAAEIAGHAGFDFAWIDREHSTLDLATTETLIAGLDGTGCASLVRVPALDANEIVQVLDLGAHVVDVPHVDTPAQARQVVEYAFYPPKGLRGISLSGRVHRHGMDAVTGERLAAVNENVMAMVQIESPEAVANVEAIAAVEGVDIVFVGSQDLTASMGIATQLDHPEYLEAIARVARAARDNGKIAAIIVPTPEALQRHREMGFTMFVCGADLVILARTVAARAEAFRAAAG